jgi:hypothetical protein
MTVQWQVKAIGAVDQAQVTHLTQQVFYGSVTNISGTGDSAQITLNIAKDNADDLAKTLSGRGFPQAEAQEVAAIAAAEKPESAQTPIGKKVSTWLGEKAKQGATEAWGIGKSVATEVLKQALKEFYGLR